MGICTLTKLFFIHSTTQQTKFNDRKPLFSLSLVLSYYQLGVILLRVSSELDSICLGKEIDLRSVANMTCWIGWLEEVVMEVLADLEEQKT